MLLERPSNDTSINCSNDSNDSSNDYSDDCSDDCSNDCSKGCSDGCSNDSLSDSSTHSLKDATIRTQASPKLPQPNNNTGASKQTAVTVTRNTLTLPKNHEPLYSEWWEILCALAPRFEKHNEFPLIVHKAVFYFLQCPKETRYRIGLPHSRPWTKLVLIIWNVFLDAEKSRQSSPPDPPPAPPSWETHWQRMEHVACAFVFAVCGRPLLVPPSWRFDEIIGASADEELVVYYQPPRAPTTLHPEYALLLYLSFATDPWNSPSVVLSRLSSDPTGFVVTPRLFTGWQLQTDIIPELPEVPPVAPIQALRSASPPSPSPAPRNGVSDSFAFKSSRPPVGPLVGPESSWQPSKYKVLKPGNSDSHQTKKPPVDVSDIHREFEAKLVEARKKITLAEQQRLQSEFDKAELRMKLRERERELTDRIKELEARLQKQ